MNKTIVFLLTLTILTATSTIIAKPASSTETKENSWATMTPMRTARFNLGVAVVNGKIYAIGGLIDNGDRSWETNANEEYDPATDSWSIKKPMPTARAVLG